MIGQFRAKPTIHLILAIAAFNAIPVSVGAQVNDQAKIAMSSAPVRLDEKASVGATINVDSGQTASNGYGDFEETEVTGHDGEKITTQYKNGHIRLRLVRDLPRSGGSPVRGSMTHHDKFSYWDNDDSSEPSREVDYVYVKQPTRTGTLVSQCTTTTTFYGTDQHGRRFKSQETVEIRELVGIRPDGARYRTRTIVKNYADSEDQTGTITSDTTNESIEANPLQSPTPHDDSTVSREDLQSAVAVGDVDMQLIGDGETTSHVELDVTNKSDHDIQLTIPCGQAFIPDDPSKFQYMMSVEDCKIDLPTGQRREISNLPTVCISSKSVPPPSKTSIYRCGQHPDSNLIACFRNVLAKAKEAEANGWLSNVPIDPQRRSKTVGQLAIWMMQADITKKPQDQITTASISKDLLQSAGKTPSSLTTKERRSFDRAVSQIFSAADLTRKTAIGANAG